MLGGGWRVWLRDANYGSRVDVYFAQEIDAERLRVLQPDGSTMEADSNGPVDYKLKPTLALNREKLQLLADALAKFGIVPESRRHQQEAELMGAHLQDMRRLVFKAEGTQ